MDQGEGHAGRCSPDRSASITAAPRVARLMDSAHCSSRFCALGAEPPGVLAASDLTFIFKMELVVV